MESKCANCPGMDVFQLSDELARTCVNYHQWKVSDGKSVKTAMTSTMQSCFDELKKNVNFFLQHTFVKRAQAAAFKAERESVKTNPRKVVVQVDFAENYTTKTQDEIQSAYWAYNQITLFTVCAWEQKRCHSLVIVSDCLTHDKYAVCCFLDLVVKYLKQQVDHLEEVVIFSDGCAGQFKQKFVLCHLTHMEIPISWNFFATSHGKGAVDGIGGEVKRIVRREVLAGKADVQNSENFLKVASQKCLKTHVMHCTKEDVNKNMPMLDKQWEGIKGIPGTKSLHHIRVLRENAVEVRKLTHSDESCVCHMLRTDEPDDEHNDDDDMPAVNSDASLSEAVRVGVWVLVKYCGKRTAKHYTGQVLSRTVDGIQVKFLKKKPDSHLLMWPDKDDIDYVDESQIVEVLPEPDPKPRGLLFEGMKSGINIQ